MEGSLLISFSLWSVDQANLAREVTAFEPIVDSFHIDVMDGYFTDDLLFGPLTAKTLRRLTRKPIVVHLMVHRPARWAARFAKAGADVLVVHPEACTDLTSTLELLQREGVSSGVAVSLDQTCTPAIDSLDLISLVLVMGTPTGVKGYPFDESALDKIEQLVEARGPSRYPDIFVDGGIRWSSVDGIAQAEADGVVAGSILASAADPVTAGAALKALTRKGDPR